MHRNSRYRFAVTVFSAVIGCSMAQAQDKPAATGSGWAAGANAQGVVEIKLDPKQIEAVKQVSGYFNSLTKLKGTFVQTDPDKKRSRGRFAMLKPGKFRFDYLPSKKVMASDGRLLRIKEPDQSTDAVELDNTPFRMLLKKDVDLLRDARILDVQESEDLIVVALQDRSPDAPGRVQLIFVKKPTIDLKEWVVRDAQGLETKVEVSELSKTDEVDPKQFIWEEGSPFKN